MKDRGRVKETKNELFAIFFKRESQGGKADKKRELESERHGKRKNP